MSKNQVKTMSKMNMQEINKCNPCRIVRDMIADILLDERQTIQFLTDNAEVFNQVQTLLTSDRRNLLIAMIEVLYATDAERLPEPKMDPQLADILSKLKNFL